MDDARSSGNARSYCYGSLSWDKLRSLFKHNAYAVIPDKPAERCSMHNVYKRPSRGEPQKQKDCDTNLGINNFRRLNCHQRSFGLLA